MTGLYLLDPGWHAHSGRSSWQEICKCNAVTWAERHPGISCGFFCGVWNGTQTAHFVTNSI